MPWRFVLALLLALLSLVGGFGPGPLCGCNAGCEDRAEETETGSWSRPSPKHGLPAPSFAGVRLTPPPLDEHPRSAFVASAPETGPPRPRAERPSNLRC